MALVPAYPEVVGRLTPAEAEVFSGDFSNDWDAIPTDQRLISAENVLLFDGHTERGGIMLPETHSQFLPAVRIAVEHERTVRGDRRLRRAVLTARQTIVQPGQAQQSNPGNNVHRDSAWPDYFYTVADTDPTQYYPSKRSTEDTFGQIRLSNEEIQQGVAFQPFDVVWASAMMYHRSTPVTVATRRTFFRLAFSYSH